MRARFASNLTMLVVGAFLAAARFAFGPETVRWIAVGVGAGAVVVIAAAFLAYGRGPVQRIIDVAMALTAGWALVSALTFAAPVIGWLSVGEGGALASLAAVGLIAHEAVMEQALWPR
jgi:hypothetical protein